MEWAVFWATGDCSSAPCFSRYLLCDFVSYILRFWEAFNYLPLKFCLISVSSLSQRTKNNVMKISRGVKYLRIFPIPLKKTSMSIAFLPNVSLVLSPAWSAIIQSSFLSKPYSTTHLSLNPYFCVSELKSSMPFQFT